MDRYRKNIQEKTYVVIALSAPQKNASIKIFVAHVKFEYLRKMKPRGRKQSPASIYGCFLRRSNHQGAFSRQNYRPRTKRRDQKVSRFHLNISIANRKRLARKFASLSKQQQHRYWIVLQTGEPETPNPIRSNQNPFSSDRAAVAY